MMNREWTIDELMCVCISRQVNDGDILAQGLATPLVAAGYLLAWHTHAPNVTFASAIGQTLCQEGAPLGLANVEALWLEKAIASFGFTSAAADLLPSAKPKEFFRPGQVDPKGNFNNIFIGKDYSQPRLRLPGSGGIPDVSTYMDGVYLYVPRHSKVTFVEKLDFLSGLGHSRLRQRGAGTRYLVSNLGEFDFYDQHMRLVSIHPGVSMDEITKKTGFQMTVDDDLIETKPPTEDELLLLRSKIDPLNIRKLEFMAGHKRNTLLRDILNQEALNSP
jgi:acyl CoA:acetate/3-ketoacid CoA transferase beta subunit